MSIHHSTKWLFSMDLLSSLWYNGVGTNECSYSGMVTRFNNHYNRDLRQIVLFGFTVIWTGSKNTWVLLNKICSLNLILWSLIVTITVIFMDKCFSYLQLIFLFIITGDLLTFFVYMLFVDRECSRKSNLSCCQSFLNSFEDFRGPRNQINQLPPEILSFG